VIRSLTSLCCCDAVARACAGAEDDIGWRPVNCENEQLTKIVKDIESAKYSGRKINFDALDHLVTLTAYAVRTHSHSKRED